MLEKRPIIVIWRNLTICLQGTPFFMAPEVVLLNITGLFYERALKKRLYVAKETYNCKEPTLEKFDHVFAGHTLFHGA